MPPWKRKASHSTSSRRARARKGKKIGINSPPGPLVYHSRTMGKSKKPAQTPRDKEREYEALYRSVGLSSEEEGDSNESDSGDEAGSGSNSEEGPTTPKQEKGMITAESPQQRDGGSKGKRVASKPPDPSSSVPYATGMAASIASTPWNKTGTSPVDDQTSTFGRGNIHLSLHDSWAWRQIWLPSAQRRRRARNTQQVHRPAHVLPQPLRPSPQGLPQRTLMRGPVAV